MSDPNQIQKPTLDNVKQKSNKFYYNFLYKASIVLIFFVIIPFFPSQPPEFIHQNFVTRNWELFHLLIVGIAISYGLFSRRNQEPDKDNNNTKFDTAQSLVSRLLHVSSFFEDETDHQNQSESEEITKVETWSNHNQHYRNKPMVVMTPQVQNSVFEEKQSALFQKKQSGCDDNEKPLLLPVRSLKSRLSDDDSVVQSQPVDGSGKINSKRFSSNSFNRVRNHVEFEGVVEDKVKEKEKEKENVVLPSPIPWRSRSASARMMEPKLEAIENDSKPSMVKTSSIKFTPSETVAKNTEDLMKKKSFYYKSYPPPPPPPPPTMFLKSRFGERNGRNVSMEKTAKGNEEEGMNEKEDEDDGKGKESKEKERVIMETDEEIESEEDEDEDDVGERKESSESSKTEEPSSSCYSNCGGGGDEGPDVDKKADEFIAKFREQIRLQRIESIKNSTRVVRNSSR